MPSISVEKDAPSKEASSGVFEFVSWTSIKVSSPIISLFDEFLEEVDVCVEFAVEDVECEDEFEDDAELDDDVEDVECELVVDELNPLFRGNDSQAMHVNAKITTTVTANSLLIPFIFCLLISDKN